MKTDNSNLVAKLDLRRYFLRRYHHNETAEVIDCCQGDGVVWKELRKEFTLRSYWGIDLKKRKGRLAVDSARVLAIPGWSANVVDIDTYGVPWKHWLAMLPNLRQTTTVFLTIGHINMTAFACRLSREDAVALGLGRLLAMAPPSLSSKLYRLAASYVLTKTCEYGINIVEAVEAESGGHARYIGVRLELQTAAAGVVTRPRPEHTLASGGQTHV